MRFLCTQLSICWRQYLFVVLIRLLITRRNLLARWKCINRFEGNQQSRDNWLRISSLATGKTIYSDSKTWHVVSEIGFWMRNSLTNETRHGKLFEASRRNRFQVPHHSFFTSCWFKEKAKLKSKLGMVKFRHSRLLTCLYNFLELCLLGPIKILNKWLSFQLSNNEKIVPSSLWLNCY